GQLKVLFERVKKKQYIYEFYKNELQGISEIGFMPENEWDEQNYWLSSITLNGKIRRVDIIKAHQEVNIESRLHWKQSHLQPIFEQYDYVGGDVSEKLFESGLCLPSDTKMTDEDLERVVKIIKRTFK